MVPPNASWLERYMGLVLRLDRLFRARADSYLVDYYYGPPGLKQVVDAEKVSSPVDLLRAADALAEALPVQGFEPARERMLSKQLRALETICRKLDGQRFSLRDEVVSYLRRYSLVSEARARKLVEVIKVPLLEAYIFTYFYGKRLMEPHLRGPDRCAVFERFLSEPLTPSDVA